MDLSERAGKSGELAQAYGMYGYMSGLLGIGGLEVFARAQQIAEQFGTPVHVGLVHSLRSKTLCMRGQWDAAVVEERIAWERLSKCGGAFDLAQGAVDRAEALFLKGQPRAAANAIAALTEYLTQRGWSTAFLAARASYETAYRACLGEFTRAMELAEQSISIAHSMHDYTSMARACIRKGYAHLTARDAHMALESLEHARELCEKHGIRYDYHVPVYHLLVRALTIEAETKGTRIPDEARMLLRKALAIGRRHPNHRAATLLTAGLYHRHCGRQKRAHAFFTDAIVTARTQGAHLVLAEARFALGQWCLDAGDARGQLLIKEARDAFEDIEAAPFLARADAALGHPTTASLNEKGTNE